MTKRLITLLCGTASMFAITAAMAQTAEQKGLETVTVTARKVSESLQDVPVAVSAISQTQLVNNAVADMNKLGELAPQVMIGRATTGTGAVLTIRGISSAAVDSGVDQSVLISYDGVSLSRGRIIESGLFDMQQVEVLQGPQMLFFGKNSPAGVISITTADPGNSFSGYAKAGYEFVAHEKYGETALSVPINEVLKMRIAARYSAMDGWIKNIAKAEASPFVGQPALPGPLQGTTFPKGHSGGGRLTLLYAPSDDFSAKFKLSVTSERSNSNASGTETFCTGGLTVPTIRGAVEPNSDCRADRVIAQNALPALYAANYPYANGGKTYLWSDILLSALTLNKTIGDITLTSTTGIYDQSHRGAHDGDFSEFIQIFDTERERYRLVNEEFRANTDFAGPVNGQAGVYYEHSFRRWFNAPDILHILDPVSNTYTGTIATSVSKNDNFSFFGQLRWKIVPELELSGGARYTHDKKRTNFMNDAANLAAVAVVGRFVTPGVVIPLTYSNNNVTPEVTLTWKPESNQTLYAAYKKGYKAGGISNPSLLAAAIATNPSSLLFAPEKTNGFEAGYKADLLNNTLRVDLVGYRYNYNGLQVTAYDSVAVRYTLRNAARARTYGLTGQFEWLATDQLTLNGNIGWNHARYLSFPDAQCYSGQTAALGCVGGVQNLSGKPLVRAPSVTFKIGADYKMPLSSGASLDWSLSTDYTSGYEAATDYSPGSPQAAYWLLNAAVHFHPESDRYQISVIGRNLTDSYYKTAAQSQSLGVAGQMFNANFARPREVHVELQYNF